MSGRKDKIDTITTKAVKNGSDKTALNDCIDYISKTTKMTKKKNKDCIDLNI